MTKPKINRKNIFALKKSRLLRYFGLVFVAFAILFSFFVNNLFLSFNYLEIFPNEFIFPVLLSIFSAFIIGTAIYFIPVPRRLAAKTLAVVIVSFFFANYDNRLQEVSGLYKAIIPTLPDEQFVMPFVSLLFLLTIFGGATLIGYFFEKLLVKIDYSKSQNLFIALLVLVGVVFFSQLVNFIPLVAIVNKQAQIQTEAINIDATKTIDKPDIYYIVLDRYANGEVLINQLGYDNSAFYNYLNSNGFNTNESAYSHYPVTTMSIASTLNLNYLKPYFSPYENESVQSRTLFHQLIRQSSVIKTLKNAGYTYYHIGSTYGATYSAELADGDFMQNTSRNLQIFEKKFNLYGMENSEFVKSPYFRFSQIFAEWWPFKSWGSNDYEYIVGQLNALDWITGEKTDQPRFIFTHILTPHDPYYFNSDGSLSVYRGSDNFGINMKQKYINQVEFINSQIKSQVDKIISADPDAVIILNADEGPYPHFLHSTVLKPINFRQVFETQDMRSWSDEWLKMKFGVLQAAYIPKATEEDMQNLSSVNVFRIVFNSYFDSKLEYLPSCNYAFTRGNQYEYRLADVTSRLSTENKLCQNF